MSCPGQLKRYPVEQSNRDQFKSFGMSCLKKTLLAQVAQAGQEHAIGSVQCLASPRALSHCEPNLIRSFILLRAFSSLLLSVPSSYRVYLLNSSPQAFAEAINLKENLKKIGVYPQPKKTIEQVEAERQVKH